MNNLSKELVTVVRRVVEGSCVLLMGASGSGKSTLAAQLAAATGAVVVSYDGHQRRADGDTGTEPVGEQALAAARAELEDHCAAGRQAIVDGTHCQPERRTAVRAIAAAHGMGTVVLVLRESLQTCLARQSLRTRRVPDADVARQHAAIAAALPTLAGEGHTAVLQLSTDGVGGSITQAGAGPENPAPGWNETALTGGATLRYGRAMTEALRPPQTTWEYCLSAADELVLWHMRQGEDVPETDRPRVVTLIGAAAYGLASSISLDGPDVAGLPLTGPDESRSASVRGVLQHHALRALQTSPYEVMGAAEREQLLAAYGSPVFDIARETAVAVITHHARSSGQTGQPHPTIRDRAPAMAGAPAAGARVDVDEARSRQQYLTAAGVIWVVYDGGLSRLPVICGQCQARTGLTLQADAEAGTARVICPELHTTHDPRLTIAGVQEAIALGGASRSGDIEINTETTA